MGGDAIGAQGLRDGEHHGHRLPSLVPLPRAGGSGTFLCPLFSYIISTPRSANTFDSIQSNPQRAPSSKIWVCTSSSLLDSSCEQPLLRALIADVSNRNLPRPRIIFYSTSCGVSHLFVYDMIRCVEYRKYEVHFSDDSTQRRMAHTLYTQANL